jgi:hypothetical protein
MQGRLLAGGEAFRPFIDIAAFLEKGIDLLDALAFVIGVSDIRYLWRRKDIGENKKNEKDARIERIFLFFHISSP